MHGRIAAAVHPKFVYAITSPSLPHVKIGRHKGLINALASRYRVYYGDLLEMHAFPVNEYVQAEKAIHAELAEYRISGELFQKDHLALYLQVMRCVIDTKAWSTDSVENAFDQYKFVRPARLFPEESLL